MANEIIKQLAEQATEYFPKTETSGEYWKFDKEKFAELIVQECVALCEMTASGRDAEYIQEAIKQHFGVE